MNLLVPAALAFGLIIPIILLLYFMRPKRQERVIGSTLLWQQALQDLQASRPWQRLRITPLLLLQLLAAIIIVLILTRPAILFGSPISGNTIIILQASASMQATDVAPSRFDEARNQINDLINGLGPNDRVSLITMAHTPQVLIASSGDKGQISTKLQQAKVTNQDADLGQALSLAASLASGHADTQVLVVGDGHVLQPDQTLTLPFPIRYLHIGTDAANAALLALASRSVQGNITALVQVANYSHQQRTIPVELYADGKLVSVQSVTIAPESTGALQWEPLAPATHTLHAHIVTQDALSADDDAWAIAGGSIHGRVLLVTKGNSFLQAAFASMPDIDLYKVTPDKYADDGSFDLTVFDGWTPPTLPNNDIFFVNPPTGSYLFGKSGQETGISHISAGNDNAGILNNVDLSSIHTLHASHQVTPALWAQTIIAAPETPLLIAGDESNRRIAALSFDLHDSDFPLQPTFPILMYNLTHWFLPPPVANNGQVSPDTPVTIQTWPGATQVSVTAPNQPPITVGPPFPVTPFNQTNQIGLYQVTQQIHGQTRQGAFTVNLFDPSQSRLAPASQLPVAHSSDFASSGNTIPRTLREIWPWIAGILLLVLCLEWWLFSRNYGTQSLAPVTTRKGTGPTRRTGIAVLDKQLQVLQQTVEKRYRTIQKQIQKRLKQARKARSQRQTKGMKS